MVGETSHRSVLAFVMSRVVRMTFSRCMYLSRHRDICLVETVRIPGVL
jgi:hypothetical protein